MRVSQSNIDTRTQAGLLNKARNALQDQEIRLVSLLPGNFEDPIRISIHHTRFIPPSNTRSRQSSPNKIQSIVPHPWTAEETNDGDTNETSWTYPSTNLLLPTVHKLDFQRYHASYTWGTMENPEMAYVVEPGVQGNEVLQRWRSIKTSPLLFDVSGPQSQQRLHRSIAAELRIF